MWRQLLLHCQALTSASPQREVALAALRDEEFIRRTCCQALRDGDDGQEALTGCCALLEEVTDLDGVDRQRLCHAIAEAQLAILLRKAGEGEVPRSAFHEWLTRRFDVAVGETASDPNEPMTGWDSLARCCQDYHGVRRKTIQRTCRDMEQLVKDAVYDEIDPRTDEERRLLDLLRELPLFPPFRYDTIPEDGACPTTSGCPLRRAARSARLGVERLCPIRAPHWWPARSRRVRADAVAGCRSSRRHAVPESPAGAGPSQGPARGGGHRTASIG